MHRAENRPFIGAQAPFVGYLTKSRGDIFIVRAWTRKPKVASRYTSS